MSELAYLIHFEWAYKHARHYLGTTTNLETLTVDQKQMEMYGFALEHALLQVLTAHPQIK